MRNTFWDERLLSRLASFQISGGQGASRCPSQTRCPNVVPLRPLCPCLSCPITPGNPTTRLSLYTHMPSSCGSSYFGLVTLSELRPIFTFHSFHWSGLLTALAARETLFSVHSFDRLAILSSRHTILHSHTALSTRYILLIRHTLVRLDKIVRPSYVSVLPCVTRPTPRRTPSSARCRSGSKDILPIRAANNTSPKNTTPQNYSYRGDG